MKLLYHEVKLASLSYILVLMYIYATLQPTRLLTCLLKKLHFHLLRSMHSQDVSRLILLVISRNNRSCFRLHVLLYDGKSSSLPSTDEAKSSFFDPACIILLFIIYLFIYRFVQCTGERTIGHVVLYLVHPPNPTP